MAHRERSDVPVCDVTQQLKNGSKENDYCTIIVDCRCNFKL